MELIDVSQVAEKLRCSARTVRRLADAGRMPKPVKVGGLTRWRVDVVDEWIGKGCPDVKPAKRSKA